MQLVFGLVCLAIVVGCTSWLVKLALSGLDARRQPALARAALQAELRQVELQLRAMEIEARTRKLIQAESDSFASLISTRNGLMSRLNPQPAAPQMAHA